MKKFVIAMGIACLSTAAHAADWWMLVLPTGKKPHRQTFFADKSSIQDVGGYRRVWLSAVDETPTQGVKSYRSFVQFDCDQSRYLMLQQNQVLMNGRTVSEPLDDKWQYIVPDTAMQLIAKNVCSNMFYDGIRTIGSSPEASADLAFQAADR